MADARAKRFRGTEWSDYLRIGIEGIDEDHRRFFSLVKDLDNALMDRHDKPEIQRLVKLVVEDCVRHFEHEERVFAQNGYPDAERNAGMHARITEEIMEMMRQFDGARCGSEWMGKALQIRQLLVDHCLNEIEKSRGFLRKAH